MMKIYEAKNHLLVLAEAIQPEKHAHMAAHIIVSLDGEIAVTVDQVTWNGSGVVIPSGAEHHIESNGNRLLVFLYDCTTTQARQIRTPQPIPPGVCKSIAEAYDLLEQSDLSTEYPRFERLVMQQLKIMDSCRPVTDDRILSAMAYMRKNCWDSLSCKTVADAVSLSVSRFSHLFSKEVGMTFAAYLIYQRLMYVYTRVISGMSITEAALEAGFSSSSHFADVNRRIFGLSARCIMRNIRFIKVS